MQVKFKAKEKGEQPKLFTQLPHRYKYFAKHPLEKHAKGCFFSLRQIFIIHSHHQHHYNTKSAERKALLPILDFISNTPHND